MMNFRLLAERVPGTWQLFAGSPTGGEVVSWAVNALTAGLDTSTLRMLASYPNSASWFEVEKDLRDTLRELGFANPPSEEEARRFRAAEIASQILAGATDVADGLDEFHRSVVSPLHHPSDLQAWCHLNDGLHPEKRYPISIEKRNLLVFQVARALLDGHENAGA